MASPEVWAGSGTREPGGGSICTTCSALDTDRPPPDRAETSTLFRRCCCSFSHVPKSTNQIDLCVCSGSFAICPTKFVMNAAKIPSPPNCLFCSNNAQSTNFKPKMSAKFHKVTCDNCGASFIVRDFIRHWKSFHMGKRPKRNRKRSVPLVCDICTISYRYDISQLAAHIFHIHLHLPLELRVESFCDSCGDMIRDKRDMARHMSLHAIRFVKRQRFDLTNPQGLRCDDCSDAVNSMASFKRHMEVVHLKKKNTTKIRVLKRLSHSCDECDFSALSRVTFLKHVFLDHRLQIPWIAPTKSKTNFAGRCDVCGRSFQGRLLFNYHNLTQHSPKGPIKVLKSRNQPSSCDNCRHLFCSKNKLQKHILRYSK